jgi:hypothetical protein
LVTTKDMAKLPKALAEPTVRADGTPEGINLSQLMEWMRCRYRWHLRYERRIQGRSVQPRLDLGSAVHAGLAGATRRFADMGRKPPRLTSAAYAKLYSAAVRSTRAWYIEWFAEKGLTEQDISSLEFREHIEEIRTLAAQICQRTLSDLQLDRWEILRIKGQPLVEQKISIPFFDTRFYGTPDFVGKDREKGGNWAVDYKCRQSLQSVEHEEVDLQLPVYQHLLAENGIPTVGTVKFQIRGSLPQVPQINKNGSMSRKRITSTWEVYQAALLQAKLDPADYQEEMKQKLDTEWFRIDRLYRRPAEIQLMWEKIIEPMGKLWAKSQTQVRHMHYLNCGGCWAREFCLAELRGEDPTFLLQTSYIDLNAPEPRMILRPEDFTFIPLED